VIENDRVIYEAYLDSTQAYFHPYNLLRCGEILFCLKNTGFHPFTSEAMRRNNFI